MTADDCTEHVEIAQVSYEEPRRERFVALVAWAAGGFLGLLSLALFGLLGFLGVGLAAYGAHRLYRALGGRRQLERATLLVRDSGRTTASLHVADLGLDVPCGDVKFGIESLESHSVVLDLDGERVLRFALLPSPAAGTDRASRLLASLGVGAAQRVARVPLRRSLGRFSIGFVTFFASLYVGAFLVGSLLAIVGTPASFGNLATPTLLLALASTLVMVKRFGSPHVILGRDGLRLRGVWNQRFLSYADVERVERGQPLVVHLRGGRRRVVLPVVAVDPRRIAGLLGRIASGAREARSAEKDAASNARRLRAASALTRGSRSTAEWEERLCGVAAEVTAGLASGVTTSAPDGGYREAAPLDREELEQIVADASAPKEERLGAAYVLSRIDPEAGKMRLRIAADATADESLRAALLALEAGDASPLAAGARFR